MADFTANILKASGACHQLGAGNSRLYQLRTLWLKDRQALRVEASGGDHRPPWPEAATAFLREFIPLQTPPNYQLVADELLRLYGLRRARSTVETYVKTHLPELIPNPQRKPRIYHRFRHSRTDRRPFKGAVRWWLRGIRQ